MTSIFNSGVAETEAVPKPKARNPSRSRPMQSHADGMFLVHYRTVVQYRLFHFSWPATVKAPIRFVTVAFSSALTRALRQIPGAKRMLRE